MADKAGHLELEHKEHTFTIEYGERDGIDGIFAREVNVFLGAKDEADAEMKLQSAGLELDIVCRKHDGCDGDLESASPDDWPISVTLKFNKAAPSNHH